MRSLDSLRVLALLAISFQALACGSPDSDEDAPELASAQEELRGSPKHDGYAIDLGVLEPDPLFGSTARAINQRGTVVGYSNVHYSPELSPVRGFRWKPSTGLVALSSLGGPSSFAADVNDREQVAGSAELPDGTMHAVVWDADGVVRDLGTLGGRMSTATGINNRGQVIGLASDALDNTRPFIWDARSGMVDLDLPGSGWAYLNGINDAGVVAGSWLQSDGSALPFKWTKNAGLTTLDILAATNGEASNINDRGDIVGYAVQDGAVIPMKWTGRWSSPVVLDAFEGGTQPWPQAINNRGTIVGWDMPPDEHAVALQWPSVWRVEPLPLEPFAIAYDINDRGQIVGVWNSHAFLWEPRGPHRKHH